MCVCFCGCKTRPEFIDPSALNDTSVDVMLDAGDIGRTCDSDAVCNDGVFCNGSERCQSGLCVREAVVCNDQIACTRDSCSEEQSRCVYAAVDSDGDGYGSQICLDATGMPLGIDCDDSDARRYPGNLEVCDLEGHDEDCSQATLGNTDVDADGVIDIRCCNTQLDGMPLCGTDCDDGRASVRPGGTEVCNGLDDDCDGMRDEDLNSITIYRDLDGDGQGVTSDSTSACGPVSGYAASGGDCDDTDVAVNDIQTEICDGKDNNCNGSIDQADSPPAQAVTWYLDGDADGFGVAGAGRTLQSCIDPSDATRHYSLLSTDCNDAEPDINPAAAERCNAIDDNCNGRADFVLLGTSNGEDDDGDARADTICTAENGTLGTDCDDADATTALDFSERCDGRDNNCNGSVDEDAQSQVWYRDIDSDGYGSAASGTQVTCEGPQGYTVLGGDCNDMDDLVLPGGEEICNGQDDDCNGAVDNGLPQRLWSLDADGDGYGTADDTRIDCQMPTGYVLPGGDCDDETRARYPGALEVCNQRDDDCDGVTDDGLVHRNYFPDLDGDGYGSDIAPPTSSCMPVDGHVTRAGDCNDISAMIRPGVGDQCDNLIDDDCDGSIDNNELPSSTVWYRDADGDTYGTTEVAYGCSAPAGSWAARGGDCNDSSIAIRPTNPELCNATDDDCDGQADDGLTFANYYRNNDGDGFGGTETRYVCADPDAAGPIWLNAGGDCNDTNNAVYPGRTELCDSTDNDCDASTDEGAEITCTWVMGASAPACVSGTCSFASCLTSTRNCDNDTTNGCETAVNTNTNNCGGCGVICSTATIAHVNSNGCLFGLCNASCQSGYGNCDGNAPNGCETSLTTAVNCGSCGTVCTSANGAGYCDNGSCAIACNTNRGNCDGTLGNGCEVNTATDSNNCGSCGRVCPLAMTGSAHITTNSTCALQTWGLVDCNLACQSTYADCNMNTTDGCEAALQTDANNCGGCRRQCPMSAPNTTGPSTCSTGQCVLACNAGFFNCDNDPYNGCESATACGGGGGGGTFLSNIEEVTMGDSHTCARNQSGEVLCWGDGTDSQIGNGIPVQRLKPVLVLETTAAPLTGAIAIAAGRNHTCAIVGSAQRRLHCWGSNALNQTSNSNGFAGQVGTISGVVMLAVGSDHVCYYNGTEIRCFGDSSSGQCGLASGTPPQPGNLISGIPGGIVRILAGDGYSCAVVDNGVKQVYCWGTINGTSYSTPTQITPFLPTAPTAVNDVTGGYNHACIRADASNYCFGSGTQSQLDGGSTSAPSQRFTSFQRVVAGREFTCGVDGGSVVRCTGINDSGQSNGSGTNSPGLVSSLTLIDDDNNGGNGTNVSADVNRWPHAASMARHMCVVAPGGQVWCWGRGDEGQLGRDSTVSPAMAARVVAP